MRNHFAETVYQLAQEDDRICVLVADISPAGSMEDFRREFPDRFVNVGVAEQVMIGMAAGMALRGFRPFAYTIATFALYRPFEMVRDDLAYQELPVTVVGIGTGLVYSTLGATHHAQEDLAIAMAVPGLSVISPCDPLEVAAATRHCASRDKGPVYLRLGKAGEPMLTESAEEPFTFGKVRYLQRGSDVCILSHGAIMSLALEITQSLEQSGHSVSVVSAHTLKPFDTEGVESILGNHSMVVVIEETSPQNGLGPKVKQLAWDISAQCTLHTFALKDSFTHTFGSHVDLIREHGLEKDKILKAIS